MWFEILTNRDGSIASCAEGLPGIDDKGRRRYFIEAESKEEAIAKLARAFEKSAAAKRRSSAANQLRNLAAGKCISCGKSKTNSAQLCTTCQARRTERKHLLRSGAPPLLKKKSSSEEKAAAQARVIERQRENDIARRKKVSLYRKRNAQIYQTVLANFEAMTPSRFRGWLVSKIHAELDASTKPAKVRAA